MERRRFRRHRMSRKQHREHQVAAVPHAAAPSETLADMALSRRIAQGDVQAFERLMRLHNRPMFRTARAILRDDAEAEDAVQEAYLQAHRSMDSFRGDA